MKRSEFVDKCTFKFNRLDRQEVENSVYAIVELMAKTLGNGGRVEVRGFGSFDVKEQKAKLARNPSTGEVSQVEAKKKVFFRPGRPLRERVNGSD